MKNHQEIEKWLNAAYDRCNQPSFIADDPVQFVHRFEGVQDTEIIGFWTAMLAWGQRKSIINSGEKLITLMDGAPYDFIRNHQEHDRAKFMDFKHRTFQSLDTLYFLEFLQHWYTQNNSLETAFSQHLTPESDTTEAALIGFHRLFFSLPDAPARTRKHVATPERNSTCKRLNMFLRWMVRHDNSGVDRGIWTTIKPAQLLIPLDVHVDRVARQLGLIERPKSDWKTVLELSENLRSFDANDPIKYDFALFGMGVLEKNVVM